MDINVLKYFKRAAQIGNMSRAAQELHISQPTLTVAIQKLEQELKVTLFERSKKGIALTPKGTEVYRQADQLIESWETLCREAGTVDDSVRGTIRIGVHTSVGCYFLPHFLPQLLKDNPLLNVTLEHDLSRHVLRSIVMNQLDLGLVMNPEKHPDLIIKEVAQDEVTIWKRKGAVVDDVLLLEPSLFQTEWVLKKIHKKGIHFPRKIESTSLEVIASLLRAGAGHAILPKRVATQMPVHLEESFAAQGLTPYRDSLCLVYRPSLRKSGAGKAVIDSILNAKE